MELCSGSLFDHFQKVPGKVVNVLPSLIDGFIQIADGVNSYHVQGKVHGDIKPENILISDKNGELKYKIGLSGLTFFPSGWTDPRPEIAQLSEKMKAPEVAYGQDPTQESDCFSVGILFSLMITDGDHPFEIGTFKEKLAEKLNGYFCFSFHFC